MIERTRKGRSKLTYIKCRDLDQILRDPSLAEDGVPVWIGDQNRSDADHLVDHDAQSRTKRARVHSRVKDGEF